MSGGGGGGGCTTTSSSTAVAVMTYRLQVEQLRGEAAHKKVLQGKINKAHTQSRSGSNVRTETESCFPGVNC